MSVIKVQANARSTTVAGRGARHPRRQDPGGGVGYALLRSTASRTQAANQPAHEPATAPA
jgi:hypothetical protein